IQQPQRYTRPLQRTQRTMLEVDGSAWRRCRKHHAMVMGPSSRPWATSSWRSETIAAARSFVIAEDYWSIKNPGAL
ncbi:MAG: hypothetical protein WCL38_08290, partial [Actinomycetota bacterium]